MRPFSKPGGLLAGLAVLCLFAGCGDPLNRQPVTGEVKLKGQPIEEGIILFDPVDAQQTGDGAKIEKGKYEIPKTKGLAPGKYRVSIYAGDGRSGQGNASPDSPNAGHKAGKERVPPDYNQSSKQIREVKSGEPNRFDFEIP